MTKLLRFIQFQRYLHPHQLERLQSTPLLSAAHKNGDISCFEDISPVTKETGTSRRLAGMQELQLLVWQAKQDRQTGESDDTETQSTDMNDGISPVLHSVSDVSAGDISTWLAGRTSDRAEDKKPSRFSSWVQESGRGDSKQGLETLHHDLDQILQKLQEMLASSFTLEGTVCDTHLVYKVCF